MERHCSASAWITSRCDQASGRGSTRSGPAVYMGRSRMVRGSREAGASLRLTRFPLRGRGVTVGGGS